MSYFKIGSNEFKNGRLKHYIQQWQKVTGGNEFLETTSGIKLDFENESPENNNYYELHFSKRRKTQLKLT